MAPLSGVFLPTNMLHLLLQTSINACGQERVLQSRGGVYLLLQKLGCKSSGLSSGQNLVLFATACMWPRLGSVRLFCPAARLV